MSVNIGDKVRVNNTASLSERGITGTVTGPRDDTPNEWWVRLDQPRPSGNTRMSWQERNLEVIEPAVTEVESVNCADLRDHAVRCSVEVGKFYLYVMPHLNSVEVVKVVTPLAYTRLGDTDKMFRGSKFADEKKLGFFTTGRFGRGRTFQYATDAGIIVDGRGFDKGNFMLDPQALLDAGIVVECNKGIVVPEGTKAELVLTLP